MFVLMSAESAGEELHPQHYLMLLLKRHLVGLYSTGRAHHTNSRIFKRLLLHLPPSLLIPSFTPLLCSFWCQYPPPPFDAPSDVCNASLLMLPLMSVPFPKVLFHFWCSLSCRVKTKIFIFAK
jgi:hypothetical protein